MFEQPSFSRPPVPHTFRSGGLPITVEWFEAAGPRSRSAVLMLHGADGIEGSERYRRGAGLIAAAGYPVALLHYLDRTGERRAAYARIVQNFLPWLDTVRDALSWIEERTGCDERVGLVGISLGGALALAAASRDQRVQALVTYFAPLPTGVVGAGPLPPTLILHGAADPIVPVANASAIAALLEERDAPYEMKVYPDQGHGFYGAAFADANRRVAAFLDRHLGQDGTGRHATPSAGTQPDNP